MRIMKSSKEVLRATKKEGLYSLEVEIISDSANIASIKILTMTELCHMILGHVNEKGRMELGKQNLLCENKVEKLKLSEPCVFRKACRAKFNKVQ